jgi:hypothetical protein
MRAICPGMPKYLQSVVLFSPTKVDVAPSKFVAAARHKGFHVDLTLSQAIKRRLHHICTPRSLTRGPPALICWGGIASAFDLYRRKRIVNFSIHSVYLIGIDIDAEQSTLVAVLSTETMILNAYRQRFWGNLVFLRLTPLTNLNRRKMACTQS